MNWTEKQIKNIVAELSDENPLACQALFSITEIEFTKRIPTLAVTLSARPRLLINKTFCDNFLVGENDVKAVLLHEFLHVLLGHTTKYRYNHILLNIATDAVINAIIHRRYGPQYSDFFRRFYALPDITFLLRPPVKNEIIPPSSRLGERGIAILKQVHLKVYEGKICADDLTELLESLQKNRPRGKNTIVFIGDHTEGKEVSEANGVLLDSILKKMDGTMIWSRGKIGMNGIVKHEEKAIEVYKISRWRKQTHELLQRCFAEEINSKKKQRPQEIFLPILNSGDKRALARFYSYSGIPMVKNTTSVNTPSSKVSIYLDVSGSMNLEIDCLITLIHYFRDYLKMPIWTFSDEVHPSRFQDGKLQYATTNGTQIASVFDHIRKNRIDKCLIITDGFMEPITPEHLNGLNLENIHFIISSAGSGHILNSCGLKYYQLKPL
jgi:hypothetical protein